MSEQETRLPLKEISTEFDARGYAVLKSVIDRGRADFLTGAARKYVALGASRPDGQVPDTPAVYGAPLMEDLLEDLLPAVEEASGRELFPTYSYYRIYRPGDTLARHKDRASCEISLSLCLGYRAPAPWPLHVEGPAGVFAAELQVGDGLLYKGTLCDHWRGPFAGETASQVFLHYVDRNGPYAQWRFDKRERLTTTRSAAG